MTLIEIMIVVAIIAMVSGGVAVVAIGQAHKAKLSHAETGARTIRQAVQTYFLENTGCPSTQDLVAEGIVDPGQDHEDPWGGPWVIVCDGLDVWVGSAGPDRQLDTEDDIFVPDGKRPSHEED